MKKKILSIALVVCIAITAIAGATLAYLQDSDMDENVMVAGNVKIVQNETDRNGDPYKDKLKLLPAVIPEELSYDGTMTNTNTNQELAKELNKEVPATLAIFDKSVNNEIDKFITVTNKGTEAAYIRTIILMENDENNSICGKVHTREGNDDGQRFVWLTNDDGSEVMVTIDNVLYSIAVCTYETPIAAGATSSPSLMQVFLDPSATNEWYDLVEEDFNILALSQAVQYAGFEELGSEVALNTAFGEVTAENVAAWFNGKTAYTTGVANKIG